MICKYFEKKMGRCTIKKKNGVYLCFWIADKNQMCCNDFEPKGKNKKGGNK